MEKFTRILENYKFGGRESDIYDTVNNIIQNIEYSYDEKSLFFNEYLLESILDLNDNVEDQYLNDLREGKLKKFYKQETAIDYIELRQYLHDTYSINLDDEDGMYIDCLWLIHLIKDMTNVSLRGINK